mmetsp:Transcript_1311/g.2346  ORF Transcript_1311/g.2346 Transcript_1311/m.2346 type:complete len:319 (-) Transcript_1311:639-1595(-)
MRVKLDILYSFVAPADPVGHNEKVGVDNNVYRRSILLCHYAKEVVVRVLVEDPRPASVLIRREDSCHVLHELGNGVSPSVTPIIVDISSKVKFTNLIRHGLGRLKGDVDNGLEERLLSSVALEDGPVIAEVSLAVLVHFYLGWIATYRKSYYNSLLASFVPRAIRIGSLNCRNDLIDINGSVASFTNLCAQVNLLVAWIQLLPYFPIRDVGMVAVEVGMEGKRHFQLRVPEKAGCRAVDKEGLPSDLKRGLGGSAPTIYTKVYSRRRSPNDISRNEGIVLHSYISDKLRCSKTRETVYLKEGGPNVRNCEGHCSIKSD